MRKLLLIIVTVSYLMLPVSAMEFVAPAAPEEAEKYMPENTESFADGLWYIVRSAIVHLQPQIAEAGKVCLSIIVIIVLVSVINSFSCNTQQIITLAGAVSIGILFMQPANTMIRMGFRTIETLNEYGKLLLPVMAGAMAAQGCTTSSSALYAGTMLFITFLSGIITNVIIPIVYVYLCLSIAACALGQDTLQNIKKSIKWSITWVLKTILYTFTGYISITGVISGTADATAIKAAKLTIAGVVPIVGGILSDASESILVSAGIMKNTAGIYGLFAMIAVGIEPFLQVGIQYLLLKFTTAVCSILGNKQIIGLLQDLSGAMGIVLGMIGSVCLLLLISIVCFMKGAA